MKGILVFEAGLLVLCCAACIYLQLAHNRQVWSETVGGELRSTCMMFASLEGVYDQ